MTWTTTLAFSKQVEHIMQSVFFVYFIWISLDHKKSGCVWRAGEVSSVIKQNLELAFSFLLCIICVELENRLLARFDAASQRRELSTMAECAKILSQVTIVLDIV